MPSLSETRLPSVAIFGPQSKTPSDKYLAELGSYIRSKEVLAPLVEAIKALPETRNTFAKFSSGIADLDDCARYLHMTSTWITGENPMQWGDEVPSGMLALPMLTIIHLAQYFQYLDQMGLTHAELLKEFNAGAGIQGYCGGMLSAYCVATASTEDEIVVTACIAIRVAVGIGAAADVVDEDNPSKLSCIMVVRLKYDGQGDEIAKLFPGTHVSAITDYRTLSLVGTATRLLDVEKYAISQKLTVSMIPLRGKMHNPANAQLARDFDNFCSTEEGLKMPDATKFLVKFRSNITTEVMTKGSLTLEVARTILADKCLWYQQLLEVSQDLVRTGRTDHSLVAFGIGDCVSLEPFRKAGLRLTKLDMFSLLDSKTPSPPMVFAPDAIAVVGMAGRFPGANNVEELWDLINSGKSMVQEVTKDRVDFEQSFRVQSDKRWASKQKFYGNFISDHDCFDNKYFGVSGKEATYMDPQQCLLLETAYQAMESSGYVTSTQQRDAGDRVGVFVGASFVDHLEHTSASTPNAYTATGTIRAFLSGKISHHFGWTGPSEVIDTACSSSLVAISRGCRALQRKECTSALVGGVNFMSTPTHTLDLGRASFLSPTGQCKPFDVSADGYCRSEGVGLIVLKLLSEAQANGDHILGVIPGISTNQGSDSKSITVPHSASQLQLYNDILAESSIDPSTISYVEAHGTGTQVGDPIEMDGIRRGFAGPDRETPVHIGSIKGNIGHCECAAGVAGVMKSILMINKGIIPPMANFNTLNPKIPALGPDNIIIPSVSKPWDAQHKAIIVNSYGAAGSNAALLMCQSPQQSAPARQKTAATYPIILSAGSKQSLTAYAASLKKHLQSPAGSGKTIAEIALALSSRKHHKFAWSTSVSNAQSLIKELDILDNIFEVPEAPKNVVLAFSGQSKQHVGLDKGLYDSCPLVQKHLDFCDQYLIKSGSASIFPAIFQTESFSDVVSLQCCMFAMQYSFAKAWIECGLNVQAVVGHSFGELTAMAVSGTLSMESTIDIIKARATLIETKWGPESGSMLVIHGTESVVSDVLSYLPKDASKVEIACYNSKTSQVVVGSSSVIAQVEQVLKDVSKFSTLRSSRADTTHGFHSYLTDRVLPELNEVAKNHTFSTPQISLEACTLEQSTTTSSERIAQHMREPVFFHHATARTEKRLGPCVWLEAGVDSPIIHMIQRALDSPQFHTFLPLKITKGQDSAATLSELTIQLWREGVRTSFFNFKASGITQVWLPPYAFERTRNWLTYVDPTMEALQNNPQPVVQSTPVTITSEAPARLVNPGLPTGGRARQFIIGTKTDRFKSIVAGHNVINNPLCPAALYLEAAIMAAQQLLGNIEKFGYTFWDFRIDSPLGIDQRRDTLLDIEGDSTSQDWSFVLKSSLVGQAKNQLHAKADFKFFTSQTGQEASQMQYHRRFANARIAAFAEKENTETFKLNRAYRLFSRVVNYSSILTGIKTITMAGNEVMAELDLPAASDTEESSAIEACDTIAMDNFVQVVGLLINSSDLCSETEAFLATGADQITVAPGVNLKTMRKFKVYACFASDGPSKTSGDIFVLSPEGALVSIVIGMHFSKLPLGTLRKILEPANQKEGQAFKAPARQMIAIPHPVVQQAKSAPVLAIKKAVAVTKQNNRLITGLRMVVAEFAGVDEAQVSNTALMSDLGIDSLAAIELVDELQVRFNIDVANTDVTSININDLLLLAPGAETPGVESEFSDCGPSIAEAGTPLTPFEDILSQCSNSGKGSKEELFSLIAEYVAIDTASIDEKADLDTLGVDSLSLIELKSAIEDAYSVELDFDTSITVSALVSMLGLEQKAAPHIITRAPGEYFPPPVAQIQESSGVSKQAVFELIAEYASIEANLITPSAALEDLGVDSLSLIELKSALEEAYSVELDFDVSATVGNVLSMLGVNTTLAPAPAPISQALPARPSTRPSCTSSFSSKIIDPLILRDPIEALEDCKHTYDGFAASRGLTGFWNSLRPKQDELVVAYVTEAFQELGSDLTSLQPGESLPNFQHLEKHSLLVQRLWDILTEAKIVEKRGGTYVRAFGALPTKSSTALLEPLLTAYPQYLVDLRLLSITGPNLAQCLTGKSDAVKLIFGNATNRDLLSSFYRVSPLFAPMTDVLIKLMDQIVPAGTQAPFRILEVGAGTGATTKDLADFLQSHGRNVEYTFTDISSTLVTAAKKKLQYSWMDFKTIDLAKGAPADLLGQYDLVLGTNVVHATANIVGSCTKIHSLLRENGILVLIELTRNVNWFDLVFGLLTGWWGATDGRKHALQTAETWSGYMKESGFSSFGYSLGPTIESSIQQILIGSTRKGSKSMSMNRYTSSKRYQVETVPYKVVDDLQIEADIYFSSHRNSNKRMPIALMLHGGGYMALSRRAVRQYQTQYLLDNGILPVSLDYRLCPEINIVDGPLQDTCDALVWAREKLPLLAAKHGVMLDTEKVVMVGWSTGGHLAMTTAWMAEKAGIEPPKAILSFYGPTDFESDYFTTRQGEEYPERSMSMASIQKALSSKVISNYDSPNCTATEQNLGFLQPGDPRSELIISLFKDSNGLSLLLNGFSPSSTTLPVTRAQLQSISPLAQVRSGAYKTPTFVIHGERDEVVPCVQSEAFVEELQGMGVQAGMRTVKGKRHIFDLRLKPGERGWEENVGVGYEFLFEQLR